MPSIDGMYTDLGGGQWAQNTQLTGSNATDAQSVLIPGMGFNGATFDRWRNNMQGTLLASAARTVAVLSPSQTNYNARGVMIFLDITAASGTGGLTVQIQAVDPISGNRIVLNAVPTAIIAIGRYAYELYPGSSAAGAAGNTFVNQRTSAVLPRTWLVVIGHGDATSYTYSVGYSMIL